eukprot:Lithocolla_globosa_v1_NODE_8017_length_866_cov_43.742962.p1 type:complete len:249 gc:universal NODE_8017_length_866_cov_43.742962:816-70(-)
MFFAFSLLVVSVLCDKVINGIPTDGEIWRGTVLVRGAGGCSGSFIHPNLVLSAAHCCNGSPQDGITVSGGAREGDVSFGSSRRHAEGGLPVTNDICLIELGEAKPSTFPHYDVFTDNAPMGADAVIVGYGLNETLPDSGFGLCRYGLVSITGYLRNDILIRNRMGTDPTQNACNGDSGGPVFAEQDGKWMVHGATSRGSSFACNPTSTVYYVNSVTNQDWIRNTAASWGYDLSYTGGNCPDCCYDYEC